jgi:hypothetical protein
MGDVISSAGEKVVEADDFFTGRDQPLAQVGPNEPGAPRNEYLHECPLGWIVLDWSVLREDAALLLFGVRAHWCPEIGYPFYRCCLGYTL